MMTWKTKKKRFNLPFDFLRHLFLPPNHLICVRPAAALISLLCLSGVVFAAAPAARPQSQSGTRAHDFVIFTTIFTEQGFALYGARTRLRRTEEKKFRWEATSDHRGELALRVPQGAEYEMTIEARGFKTQTRKIDAREDLRTDLTVRMEPATQPSAAPHAEPQAQKSPGGQP